MIKQSGAWVVGWRVLAFLGAGCRPGSTPAANPPALRDEVLVTLDGWELTRADLELEPRLTRPSPGPDPTQGPSAAPAGASGTVQCQYGRLRLDAGRNACPHRRAELRAKLKQARAIEQDYLAGLRSRFPARHDSNAIEAASSAWLQRSKAPAPPTPRIGGAQ